MNMCVSSDTRMTESAGDVTHRTNVRFRLGFTYRRLPNPDLLLPLSKLHGLYTVVE